MLTVRQIYGFVAGDFFGEGGQLVRMPWGIVSLVDLYTGFTLVSVWIWFREKLWWVALLWTIAMMGLGNFTFSLYCLVHLYVTRGQDWAVFFMGKHASRQTLLSSSD